MSHQRAALGPPVNDIACWVRRNNDFTRLRDCTQSWRPPRDTSGRPIPLKPHGTPGQAKPGLHGAPSKDDRDSFKERVGGTEFQAVAAGSILGIKNKMSRNAMGCNKPAESSTSE
jgi:hypothetical protein